MAEQTGWEIGIAALEDDELAAIVDGEASFARMRREADLDDYFASLAERLEDEDLEEDTDCDELPVVAAPVCRECRGSGVVRYSTGGWLSDWVEVECRCRVDAAPVVTPVEPETLTVTPVTHPDSPARWTAAYNRALANGLMIRPSMFGGPLWVVTSGSRSDLVYATDGVICGRVAAEKGDPICQHRAMFRAVHGTLPTPSNVVAFPQRPETRPAA